MSCVSRRDKTAAAGLESRRAGERDREPFYRKGASTMATITALRPGTYGFPVNIRKQYQNYIGGEWTKPASGSYFENVTPVTGQVLCEIPRSNAADIDKALDAAHAAKKEWGKTSPAAARAHPGTDCAAHGRQPGDAGHGGDVGQRQADPRDDGRRPAAERSITSATSPAAFARRRAASPRSTRRRSRITITSRWAWSG